MPSVDQSLVFLGDSLTAFGQWGQFFPRNPHLLNRGITGNTTHDVLGRLHEVTRQSPGIVVLMIGTNDLLRGSSIEATLAGVREIVARLREACPSAQLVLLGVLPVREEMLPGADSFNAKARELNRLVREWSSQDGLTQLDFHAEFLDEDGQLRRELTDDGVHLVPEAYALWAQRLRPALEAIVGAAV